MTSKIFDFLHYLFDNVMEILLQKPFFEIPTHSEMAEKDISLFLEAEKKSIIPYVHHEKTILQIMVIIFTSYFINKIYYFRYIKWIIISAI